MKFLTFGTPLNKMKHPSMAISNNKITCTFEHSNGDLVGWKSKVLKTLRILSPHEKDFRCVYWDKSL